MAQTLYDKIWEQHVVNSYEDGTSLLYIDRHLVHEVTSPQAFSGLRERNRGVRHTGKVLAVADHNTPTHSVDLQDCSSESRIQLEALAQNSKDFDILYYPLGSENNGVCHVVAPELGFTLPGTTLVCGDSHTATHGAFGSISFGIGTSEVEHVLATQCLKQKRAKNMRIRIDGELSTGVYPKDVILYIISKIGTAGGTGYAIEFCGEVFKNMSMEGRMTICNMTIEAGARFGLIAPDETTFKFLRGTKLAPEGELFEQAVAFWSNLQSDEDAIFDKEYVFFAKDIEPQVSWGTSPEDSSDINSLVPMATNDTKNRALKYMGLEGNENILGLKIDRVFIGSCTNSRIEDLRIAASVVKGKKVSSEILSAIVVPGSGLVRKQAESEGLDKIFLDAGLEWRLPGCSMCLAMNSDKAGEGERVASTSNRNFEGRQGYKARTHLMSPAMAAAAAICGKIVDIRKFS